MTVDCNAYNCEHNNNGTCDAENVFFRVFEDEENKECMDCKTYRYKKKEGLNE